MVVLQRQPWRELDLLLVEPVSMQAKLLQKVAMAGEVVVVDVEDVVGAVMSVVMRLVVIESVVIFVAVPPPRSLEQAWK